jgi:hypothetical protein
MQTRSSALLSVFWLSPLLSGCTGEAPGRSPEEQYEEVLSHAREGRLASAYRAWLPPSYERELDDVLSQLGRLVDEEEYGVLRQALSAGGGKLAGIIAFAGGDDPAVKLMTARLRELPEVLGIDTYERFRRLSVASLLGAIEERVFRDVMRLESVREKVANLRFRLKDEKRDWARLEVIFEPPDGEPVVDEMDLIRFEGRWIPDDWVTDWPRTMRAWRDAIEAAVKAKLETPAAFKKSLAAIGDAVENPSSLLKYLPELNERLGLDRTAAK